MVFFIKLIPPISLLRCVQNLINHFLPNYWPLHQPQCRLVTLHRVNLNSSNFNFSFSFGLIVQGFNFLTSFQVNSWLHLPTHYFSFMNCSILISLHNFRYLLLPYELVFCIICQQAFQGLFFFCSTIYFSELSITSGYIFYT